MWIKVIKINPNSNEGSHTAECNSAAYASNVVGVVAARSKPAKWMVRKRTKSKPELARNILVKLLPPLIQYASAFYIKHLLTKNNLKGNQIYI